MSPARARPGVRAPSPGPLDRDDAPAERDLALLVTVAVGRAIGVGLAPLPDDLGDLLLHQLGEDAEADADRERDQALLRSAHELAERHLHALRQLPAPSLGEGDDLDSL